MLKNYLKIAWRNLVQNKSHAIINILGLSIGMACCILIALYVNQELSYDRFHENSDRIAVIGYEQKQSAFPGDNRSLFVQYSLADAASKELSQVEKATRLDNAYKLKLSRKGNEYITTESCKYADENFFDIFSFQLLKGDVEEALKGPNQVVLTKSLAEKLFADKNPMGQTLHCIKCDGNKLLQVSGIVKNPPANSTIQFDALVSYQTKPAGERAPDNWSSYSHKTYALLQSSDDYQELSARLDSMMIKKHDRASSHDFFAKPLTSMHLSDLTNDQGFTGNASYLYMFISVAIFILLLACFNYINLATARASVRAKEVSIRKTVGANRNQLIVQFLSESVLLSFSAFVLGLLMAEIALPYFEQLFNTDLSIYPSIEFIGWLAFGAIIIGLISGLYPSLYLTGFSPVSILKDQLPNSTAGTSLRKGMVIAQFGIALILITGSLAINKQLQYFQNKDLGFDEENLVMVQISGEAWGVRHNLRREISNHNAIKGATIANAAPTEYRVKTGNEAKRFSEEAQVDEESTMVIAPAVVDPNYLQVMGIELLAGNNFSDKNNSGESWAYIINKKAADKLGWTTEEAVGKSFELDNPGKVIGVTENFHFTSLKNEIGPVALQLEESWSFKSSGILLARLQQDQVKEGLDYLKEKLSEYGSEESFQYSFLGEKFDKMYRTEQRFGTIINSFTFLAILIACLGLYGLASFATDRRTKEIGIRKVVGAGVGQILWLLNKDFLKLVVVGYVVGIPIAWYVTQQWLQNFAYKVEIGLGIYALAGTITILIAMLTVSWRSIQAALSNPADSIRNE